MSKLNVSLVAAPSIKPFIGRYKALDATTHGEREAKPNGSTALVGKSQAENILSIEVTDKCDNRWTGEIVKLTERTGEVTWEYTHWAAGEQQPNPVRYGKKGCILKIAVNSGAHEILLFGNKPDYGDEIFRRIIGKPDVCGTA